MIHKAAPAWQGILAMTAMELRLALRRGETLVATAVLPVVVLLFFSSVSVIPVSSGRPVDFLLPGSIAFAVIACRRGRAGGRDVPLGVSRTRENPGWSGPGFRCRRWLRGGDSNP